VAELPNRVVQALELRPDDTVADIGAGTGYFTFRLAGQVPQGQVLAVDIESAMLDTIRHHMADHQVANVVPIRGTETNPNLPAAAVDVALLVVSYHEFSHPHEMMEGIVAALKPGGRLVLVEYRGEDTTLPVPPLRRMTEAQARKEMEAVGLRWRETRPILPQQHFMVFEKGTRPP
jgi:ubiquinone/menaquinone biosynthesis C-methylase UbiE